MILDYRVPQWKRRSWEASDRMELVRLDVTRMISWLRDVNVDIWTESPSDETKLTAGREHYPLEAWRSYFKRLNTQLTNYLNANGVEVEQYDAEAKAAFDGFLASMPVYANAFNQLMTNYRDAQGNTIQKLVTQSHRNALANALEAQLAPAG